MEKQDYQRASRVIRYNNDRLRERHIGISNQLYLTPVEFGNSQATFFTPDGTEVEFKINYKHDISGEEEYGINNEWEGKLIPSVHAIDGFFRDWMTKYMSIQNFEL